MADELTTTEAAERLGVKPDTLLQWQRRGLLTPRSEGSGHGRRLFWTEKDLSVARDLQRQDSSRSTAKAFVDALGGEAIIAQYYRALEIADAERGHGIVVVTSAGIRFIRGDDAPEPVLQSVGGVALMILT